MLKSLLNLSIFLVDDIYFKDFTLNFSSWVRPVNRSSIIGATAAI